jgi:hypothetical protein
VTTGQKVLRQHRQVVAGPTMFSTQAFLELELELKLELAMAAVFPSC